MPQVYQGDEPILTGAEPTTDLTSLTTGESAQHMDSDTSEYHGHEGKRSLFGKLKDKTKTVGSKLKSKMKKSGDPAMAGTGVHDEEEFEDEEEEEPTKDVPSSFGTSPAPLSASHYTAPSSTPHYTAPSSTPHYSAPPSMPLHSSPIPDSQYTAPQSAPRAFGTFDSQSRGDTLGSVDATPTPDPAAPSTGLGGSQPISQFRSDGPASVMQAVPTQYRDYANDSLTSESQYPSAVSKDIAAGGLYDSGAKKVQESDALIPEGIMKPTDFDSTPATVPETTSKDLEPIIPYTETETKNYTPDTTTAADKESDLKSSVPDNLTAPFNPESTAESRGYEPETPVQSVATPDYTPETTSETKDFTPSSTSGFTPSYTEKASQGASALKDTVYGGAAAAAGAVGYNMSKAPEDQSVAGTTQANPGKTWSNWASEKTQQAKDTAGSVIPSTTSQTTSAGDYAAGAQGKTEEVGQRAYDGTVDTKNSVVNPGKTWSDWASEKTQQARDTAGSVIPSTTSQTTSAGDYAAGAQGKTEEVGQRAYDGTVDTKNSVVNPGKTWSDWASEKTQQAKDTAGSVIPSTTSQTTSAGDYAAGAQGKTEEVGQRAYDGTVDTKNSVVNPGKTWSDWASEKTQQAKDTTGSVLPSTTSQNTSAGDYAAGAQGKTEEVGQRAYDGTVDTKNSVTSPGKTWSDWAAEKTQQAKDTAGSVIPTTASQTPSAGDYAAGSQGKTEEVGQRAYDGTVDSKNSVASAGKTWSDWAAEKAQQAKDTAASAIPGTTSQNTSAGDYAAGAQGKTEEVGQRAYDGAVDTKNSVVNPGKTWSDWAAEKAQQAKDTVGSAIPSTTSQNTTAGDYATGAQGKTEEVGQRAYDGAVGRKNAVQNKANEGVGSMTGGSSGPNVPGSATEAGYVAKDSVQSKAADLNNATNDSETYTQKAANSAYAAKDAVVSTLGLNKPSEGPSVVDQTKGYLASAVGTTKGYTQAAVDTTKNYVNQATGAGTNTAKDTTGDYAGTAADTAKNYTNVSKDVTAANTAAAVETAKNYAGSGANTSKDSTGAAVDTTKGYAGSAVDTTKDYTGAAVDTSKDYTGRAYDTTAQYAQAATDTTKNLAQKAVDATKGYTQAATDTSKGYTQTATDQTATAKDTAVDTLTPKEHDKALSDQVTETISNLPGQIKDTVASYTQPTTATHPTPVVHDDPHKQDGIVGRLTGLFGFGKHNTPAHPESPVTTPTAEKTADAVAVPTSETVLPTLEEKQ